ncbi:MAG: hypothetical protein V4469_04940 [Patescibacteria group bacterium]
MQVYRTKFKGEIIAEFVVPKKMTNKVMIICGGMPTYPAKEKYSELFEFYTAKGFSVFVPRYRGSWESGGQMFTKSPHFDIKDIMDELPNGFKDLWNGTLFKIENPEVYIIGSSFGGPAGLLNSKDSRVKKVICFCSVLDWRTMDDTVEPISLASQLIADAFGNSYRIVKNGWNKIEKGELYNPTTEIDKIDGAKCLIIQAKDDNIVSVKAVLPFIDKTHSKLWFVSKGGHLGMSLMKKRFAKKCFDFLKSK